MKIKSPLLATLIALGIAFIFSCSSTDTPELPALPQGEDSSDSGDSSSSQSITTSSSSGTASSQSTTSSNSGATSSESNTESSDSGTTSSQSNTESSDSGTASSSSSGTTSQSNSSIMTCTMSKSIYITGERPSASSTGLNTADCIGLSFSGLKASAFTDADAGSYPAGTVKVSATCVYDSKVVDVSQDCPAFTVEAAPKPTLTCELGKSKYLAQETAAATSVVTSNGATCDEPTISGSKTFTDADVGSKPAGTIKASVSCSYRSVSLPVVSQDCPAFTVELPSDYPTLTCELGKTKYIAGETAKATSDVTPRGATCGLPAISGLKTFSEADVGNKPAGTIKASASCDYNSKAITISQNCPAFTVESDCADIVDDLTSRFCFDATTIFNSSAPGTGTNNRIEFNTTNPVCVIISSDAIASWSVYNTGGRSYRANGKPEIEVMGGYGCGPKIDKFPTSECGKVYLYFTASTSSISYTSFEWSNDSYGGGYCGNGY